MKKSKVQGPKEPKKPQPPLSGLAIVASLWLWGAILFYAPTYLGIVGGWRVPFNVLGAIALIISFGGALVELGKFWKSEALSYWGVGLVFLIPAGILFALVKFYSLPSVLETITKAAALLLLAFSGPFFFMGVPYFFWKEKQEQFSQSEEEVSEEEAVAQNLARRKARFTTIASIIIAFLSLATAVAKLVLEVLP